MAAKGRVASFVSGAAPDVLVLTAPLPTAALVAASLFQASSDWPTGFAIVIGAAGGIVVELSGLALSHLLVDTWSYQRALRPSDIHKPLPWLVPALAAALLLNFVAAELAVAAIAAHPLHYAMPVYSLLSAFVAAVVAHLADVRAANAHDTEVRRAAWRESHARRAQASPSPSVPIPSPSVPVGKVGKPSAPPKLVSVSAPRTYSSLSAADLETIRAVASPRQLMDMFGVSDTTAYKWKTRATGSGSASPSPSNGRPAKPEDNNNNSNKSVGEGEAVAVVGQS